MFVFIVFKFFLDIKHFSNFVCLYFFVCRDDTRKRNVKLHDALFNGVPIRTILFL